jgi:hypothetical protein
MSDLHAQRQLQQTLVGSAAAADHMCFNLLLPCSVLLLARQLTAWRLVQRGAFNAWHADPLKAF